LGTAAGTAPRPRPLRRAVFFDLDVQREADDLDESAHFAVVVTLEMPGEVEVYSQVLNRVGLKPTIPVSAM
jgi:hypothetical protein